MASTWLAYNDLAWTEDWLVLPEDYEEEAGLHVDLILRFAAATPQTLLHLGSGAGGMDRVFKRYFDVTGVDLSQGMLDRARAAHPDIEYLEADMRTLRLGRLFDAVAIPDSIDYMVSPDDLRQAIGTAAGHLKPGGILLVVGKTKETFRDNNFAYTGERDGVHVTVLENNYINPFRPGTYEATLIYLIRRQGALTVQTDNHVLGLFPQALWDGIFREAGLKMQQQTLDGVYDRYLLEGGRYPLQIFVGWKTP